MPFGVSTVGTTRRWVKFAGGYWGQKLEIARNPRILLNLGFLELKAFVTGPAVIAKIVEWLSVPK
jgi:hypothetical protein